MARYSFVTPGGHEFQECYDIDSAYAYRDTLIRNAVPFKFFGDGQPMSLWQDAPMTDEEFERFKSKTDADHHQLVANESAYRDAIAKKFFWDCTVGGFCAGLVFCIIVTAIVELIR